jgi:hypothetical protein
MKAKQQAGQKLNDLKVQDVDQGAEGSLTADAVRGGVAPVKPKAQFKATFEDVLISS